MVERYQTPSGETVIAPEDFNDHVIIAGLGKNWNEKGQLSTASVITALATTIVASEVLQNGGKPLIIFSSGYTNGFYANSEAGEMRSLLSDEEGRTVMVEENSWSTQSNALYLKRDLEHIGVQPARVDKLVTVGPHVKRAVRNFEREGLIIGESIASERMTSEIIDRYPEYLDRVEDYHNSVEFTKILFEETVLRGVDHLPLGRFLIDYISKKRLDK